MGVDKRSKSEDMKDMRDYMRRLAVLQRDDVIRSAIWGTYVGQDLLMRAHHDSGGLSQIFKHKLAYRALIARGRVQSSEVGWIPGLDPESQVAALAKPAALLAAQRDQSLAVRAQNLLARLPSSAE